MKCELRNRLFLLWKDFRTTIRENKFFLTYSALWLALGVGIGIYIGIRIGESVAPISVFGRLLRGDYSPFRYIARDLLRWCLLSNLVFIGYYLTFPRVFSAIALSFYGKYFGQIACVTFLSDTVVAAVLSMIIVYIPLLILGAFLLFRLVLSMERYRTCGRETPNGRSLLRLGSFLAIPFVAYTAFLFACYLVVCGSIYLFLIML